MPLYDFRCRSCEAQFEALVAPGTTTPCPNCGGTDVERQFSAIARPLRFGLRGAAARRSNAIRKGRAERRREQRAQRRDASS